MDLYKLILVFLIFPLLVNAQTLTTVSDGDIEAASTWAGAAIPPFTILPSDLIEVPADVELIVNHDLTTTRNEIINRGVYVYNDLGEDTPSINWRNYGNMTLGGSGWATSINYFINEASGKMLFKDPSLWCHHLGCTSENYGVIYVKQRPNPKFRK